MAKQKHFLVRQAIQPYQLTDTIERVEIEVVFSKAVQEIAWRDLQDGRLMRQGWRTSGKNLLDFFMGPSLQELKSPQIT